MPAEAAIDAVALAGEAVNAVEGGGGIAGDLGREEEEGEKGEEMDIHERHGWD